MSCGKCSGKGCCSTSEPKNGDTPKNGIGTLFITFKVFPLNTNVALLRI
ncbi:MAG: hypothetical protein NWF07_06135 [Candidatus Bathyarchaeota archaeon]|nr:hypothetical protein [Candidatus Bathyarchaeota archaeon]